MKRCKAEENFIENGTESIIIGFVFISHSLFFFLFLVSIPGDPTRHS